MLFAVAVIGMALSDPNAAVRTRGEACAAPAASSGATSAKPVRFAYLDHGIYVQATIAGRMAGWFLLDTGSGAVVVDRRVARKLGLRVVDTATVEGTTGRQRAEIVAIDTLSIGCFEQPGIFAAATDLSTMRAPDGSPLAGVIGYDILQSLSVRIDFAAREITLSAAAAPDSSSGATRVPFVIDASAPRFDAVFDGRFRAQLRLDTGLGSTGGDAYATLPYSLWDELGSSTGIERKRIDAHGIGGPTALGAIRVHDLSVGTAHVSQPWVLGQERRGYFARADAAGLVGNTFLERFSPVTIDYVSGAMYLTTKVELANAVCGRQCR